MTRNRAPSLGRPRPAGSLSWNWSRCHFTLNLYPKGPPPPPILKPPPPQILPPPPVKAPLPPPPRPIEPPKRHRLVIREYLPGHVTSICVDGVDICPIETRHPCRLALVGPVARSSGPMSNSLQAACRYCGQPRTRFRVADFSRAMADTDAPRRSGWDRRTVTRSRSR